MNLVLYNPKSNNGRGLEGAKKIEELLPGAPVEFVDATSIGDYYTYIEASDPQDQLIITGGDGTLNYLANALAGRPISRELLYFPSGSGNDFFTDIKDREAGNALISLNKYITGLPTAIVDGKKWYFLNNVGFGIDGYCCEKGDELRAKSDKPINYTSIAIKGLLFNFKPRDAKVTVDGVTKEYKHVWLAPTMNGRYYGGGMNAAPGQDRLNPDNTLSCMVMHHPIPLGALIIFPKIFEGKLVNYKKHVEVLVGKHVQVEFAKPCAVQVDGETVLNMTSYEAFAAED